MAHNKIESADFYLSLDRGIRFAVRVLHAAGFETCQSCQGGPGHSYPEPTVEMVAGANDADGFGAIAALHEYGLPVGDLCLRWRIQNGLPFEKLWSIVFYKTMDDRADEIPAFVWNYSSACEEPRP